MLYSVLALLVPQGLGASKHAGVVSLFDQHFVKTGKLPIELSKSLHKSFDLRQIGDYRELMDMDREQAEEVLGLADRFVVTVEGYLSGRK